MARNEDKIDFARAQLDPGGCFASPEALRDYPGFSLEQKVDLLRRWAYDCAEISVAEEEGMMGGETTQADNILAVLDAVCGGYDVEHSPPTKQRGI